MDRLERLLKMQHTPSEDRIGVILYPSTHREAAVFWILRSSGRCTISGTVGLFSIASIINLPNTMPSTSICMLPAIGFKSRIHMTSRCKISVSRPSHLTQQLVISTRSARVRCFQSTPTGGKIMFNTFQAMSHLMTPRPQSPKIDILQTGGRVLIFLMQRECIILTLVRL